MPTFKKQIILNEQDIKDLVIKQYKLNPDTTDISISYYEGNSYERSYLQVYVTTNTKEL